MLGWVRLGSFELSYRKMAKYIHAFWHVENTDYQKLWKIFCRFQDFQYAWERAAASELEAAGLGEVYSRRVVELRAKLDLGRAMEKLWDQDIKLIDRASPEFPQELGQITAPPFLIYRKGAELSVLTNRIAIVGTRKSSGAGEKLSFALAGACGQRALTVVSGLAFGIDAAAHAGVIKSGGLTIGILASGIAKVTPTSHTGLADRILEKGGAIISEYPVTSDAFKHRFLERNRLIAALSHTVVIVEAAKKSGALITAEYALEQGKTVLAFPGDPGKPTSRGCNELIKKGPAQLVCSVGDVLESLADRRLISARPQSAGAGVNLELADKRIIDLLGREEQSAEGLLMMGKLEWSELLQSISKLEIAGVIGKTEGSKWKLLAD